MELNLLSRICAKRFVSPPLIRLLSCSLSRVILKEIPENGNYIGEYDLYSFAWVEFSKRIKSAPSEKISKLFRESFYSMLTTYSNYCIVNIGYNNKSLYNVNGEFVFSLAQDLIQGE